MAIEIVRAVRRLPEGHEINRIMPALGEGCNNAKECAMRCGIAA